MIGPFSEREIKLFIHKALAAINAIVAIYTLIAAMHFTFNVYDEISTNTVAIICYATSIYAFLTCLRYEKSVTYLTRKRDE